MADATVLYDAPGPVTIRRQRVYSAIFLVVVAAVLVWVVIKLENAGEFDSRVWNGLTRSNVISALQDGLLATFKAAVISIVLAVVLGFMLAVGRLSDHRWIRLPFWAVIEFLRAVPVLLMMLLVLKLTGGHDIDPDTRGLIAVVVGLTLYNGSVLAEVFRAGVQAVPKGQVEAAYAIGLRKNQVMTIVLLPQAVRFMLPAIISQCVVALKDTSLGYIVLYPETVRQGKLIAQFLQNNLMVFAVIAVLFIIMNNLLSELASWLERRLSRRGRASKAAAAVEEVLPAG
jgi:glutamate transport system permease protein